MIDALIAGRLYRAPHQHTAASGMLYTQATVRVSSRNGSTVFIHAVAFFAEPAHALLALAEGDAVALAGELTLGVWTPKDGEPRPSADLVVHQVLTAYHVARRRKAVQDAGEGRIREVPLDDELPDMRRVR